METGFARREIMEPRRRREIMELRMQREIMLREQQIIYKMLLR